MDYKIFKKMTEDENYILSGKKFDNYVIFIGICEIDEKPSFILEKRAIGIRQGGEISFPGGKIEEFDENPEESAIRETMEELGIPREKIDIIGKYGIQTNPYGMIIHCYLGLINIKKLEELNPQKSEVERILCVPLEFFFNTPPQIEKIQLNHTPNKFMQIKNIPDSYRKPWKGYKREIYFWEYNCDVIWGITGEIIFDFIGRYNNMRNYFENIL
ncbi:MAG: CoA pyrophosphatase [Fusobacteriaceae bacterium]|jgi:8-oxo-dGTP pyrophosphatase MutT (NUDIX family)|nr:CoA pyrophosphatase [Fusobacteriaceae bacterium]